MYQPLTSDAQGRLVSEQLNLALMPWEGEYQGISARWLRLVHAGREPALHG